MIELGKKSPGPSLRKLFESFEQSQVHPAPAHAAAELKDSYSGSTGAVPDDSLCSMLSTETLIRSVAEVAAKLSLSDRPKQERVIGSLRELLDEFEQRLLAGSAGHSETQPSAVPAAKPDASQGIK
jgi:hypothetical protein